MRWAENKKHWLSSPETYPLIAILGGAGVFVCGFITYFLITAPDVQISPIKRWEAHLLRFLDFILVKTPLTHVTLFCLWTDIFFRMLTLASCLLLSHTIDRKLSEIGNERVCILEELVRWYVKSNPLEMTVSSVSSYVVPEKVCYWSFNYRMYRVRLTPSTFTWHGRKEEILITPAPYQPKKTNRQTYSLVSFTIWINIAGQRQQNPTIKHILSTLSPW